MEIGFSDFGSRASTFFDLVTSTEKLARWGILEDFGIHSKSNLLVCRKVNSLLAITLWLETRRSAVS